MSYAVVMSAQARDVLRHLPFEVVEFAWDEIEQLLLDPVNRAGTARSGNPSGQVYRFSAEFAGIHYLFALFFKDLDSRDENQIGIGRNTVTSWTDSQ